MSMENVNKKRRTFEAKWEKKKIGVLFYTHCFYTLISPFSKLLARTKRIRPELPKRKIQSHIWNERTQKVVAELTLTKDECLKVFYSFNYTSNVFRIVAHLSAGISLFQRTAISINYQLFQKLTLSASCLHIHNGFSFVLFFLQKENDGNAFFKF